MRRWLCLALMAIGLAGPAAATDSGLKRLTMRADTLGWEAVGRLDIGTQGYCTGVLIAVDLVLTAGHCVVDKAGQYYDPGTLVFRAGLSDGASVAEVTAAASVAHPAYLSPKRPSQRIAHDVALVLLSHAIPAATADPFVLGPRPRKGAELSLVSYARGRDAAQSWQPRCRVVEADRTLIAVSCQSTFGASGAPIFQKIGRRVQIVSMISSGTEFRGEKVALGMDLARPVADLKLALRTGKGVELARTAPAPKIQRRAPSGARFVRP